MVEYSYKVHDENLSTKDNYNKTRKKIKGKATKISGIGWIIQHLFLIFNS